MSQRLEEMYILEMVNCVMCMAVILNLFKASLFSNKYFVVPPYYSEIKIHRYYHYTPHICVYIYIYVYSMCSIYIIYKYIFI